MRQETLKFLEDHIASSEPTFEQEAQWRQENELWRKWPRGCGDGDGVTGMRRDEVLASPGYWAEDWRLKLYRAVAEYKAKHRLSRSQLARRLGVPVRVVAQALTGEFEGGIGEYVELCVKVGKTPRLELEDFADSEGGSGRSVLTFPCAKFVVKCS